MQFALSMPRFSSGNPPDELKNIVLHLLGPLPRAACSVQDVFGASWVKTAQKNLMAGYWCFSACWRTHTHAHSASLSFKQETQLSMW